MSLDHPAYWVAYVPESTETGTPMITAVAPEVLPRQRVNVDTRGLLAAAEVFHVHHPDQHLVFAGAVTRWLRGKGLEWHDLGVDFFEALRELDVHAPALEFEATGLSMAVVASAAKQCTIRWADGRSEPLDVHVEPVRAALLQVLKCEWPVYSNASPGRRRPRLRPLLRHRCDVMSVMVRRCLLLRCCCCGWDHPGRASHRCAAR